MNRAREIVMRSMLLVWDELETESEHDEFPGSGGVEHEFGQVEGGPKRA